MTNIKLNGVPTDRADEFPSKTCTSTNGSCPEPFLWACSISGRCINRMMVCNGQEDCTGAEDEEAEMCKTFICPEFKCTQSSKCIEFSSLCNNVNDCAYGKVETPDDEADDLCNKGEHKTNSYSACNDTLFWSCDVEIDTFYQCKNKYSICNGDPNDYPDCASSDENSGLCQTWECPPYTWKCNSTLKCIAASYMCNGLDESGEGDCEIKTREREFADENIKHCTDVCSLKGQWYCPIQGCINIGTPCDLSGQYKIIKDFKYNSSNTWECPQTPGIFIPNIKKCDESFECPNGEDEKNSLGCERNIIGIWCQKCAMPIYILVVIVVSLSLIVILIYKFFPLQYLLGDSDCAVCQQSGETISVSPECWLVIVKLWNVLLEEAYLEILGSESNLEQLSDIQNEQLSSPEKTSSVLSVVLEGASPIAVSEIVQEADQDRILSASMDTTDSIRLRPVSDLHSGSKFEQARNILKALRGSSDSADSIRLRPLSDSGSGSAFEKARKIQELVNQKSDRKMSLREGVGSTDIIGLRSDYDIDNTQDEGQILQDTSDLGNTKGKKQVIQEKMPSATIVTLENNFPITASVVVKEPGQESIRRHSTDSADSSRLRPVSDFSSESALDQARKIQEVMSQKMDRKRVIRQRTRSTDRIKFRSDSNISYKTDDKQILQGHSDRKRKASGSYLDSESIFVDTVNVQQEVGQESAWRKTDDLMQHQEQCSDLTMPIELYMWLHQNGNIHLFLQLVHFLMENGAVSWSNSKPETFSHTHYTLKPSLRSKMARAIFELENGCHNGNACEAIICLQASTGTTEQTSFVLDNKDGPGFLSKVKGLITGIVDCLTYKKEIFAFLKVCFFFFDVVKDLILWLILLRELLLQSNFLLVDAQDWVLFALSTISLVVAQLIMGIYTFFHRYELLSICKHRMSNRVQIVFSIFSTFFLYVIPSALGFKLEVDKSNVEKNAKTFQFEKDSFEKVLQEYGKSKTSEKHYSFLRLMEGTFENYLQLMIILVIVLRAPQDGVLNKNLIDDSAILSLSLSWTFISINLSILTFIDTLLNNT